MELEAQPAVSLTLANLEGTEVSTFSITGPLLPDAGMRTVRILSLGHILRGALSLSWLKWCGVMDVRMIRKLQVASQDSHQTVEISLSLLPFQM